jgi:hypothetical protein
MVAATQVCTAKAECSLDKHAFTDIKKPIVMMARDGPSHDEQSEDKEQKKHLSGSTLCFGGRHVFTVDCGCSKHDRVQVKASNAEAAKLAQREGRVKAGLFVCCGRCCGAQWNVVRRPV